jgi:hypothetical protein
MASSVLHAGFSPSSWFDGLSTIARYRFTVVSVLMLRRYKARVIPRQAGPRPREERCVVAQTGSPLCRRLPTCEGRLADCQPAIQQINNLRYETALPRIPSVLELRAIMRYSTAAL